MEIKYPNILLVTSSTFNHYTGTGILLTNLFKGWPINKIAMIHNDNFPPNKSVCQSFYKLGKREIKILWPFSTILNKRYPGKSKSLIYNKFSGNVISSAAKTIRLSTLVSNTLGGHELFCKQLVSRNLLQWIIKLKPNLIYCHISSLNNIIFMRELKRILKVPLIIHIMDDWLSVRYKSGLFAPVLRLLYLREFKKLLIETSIRIGICEKMCQTYEKRYGYSFIPFSNTIDSSIWLKYIEKPKKKNNSFQIVYAGTINDKNFESLKIIGNLVEDLYSKGTKIQLKISSFKPRVEIFRSKLEKKPSVIIKEVPDNDKDMALLLSSADLLFLPIDFNKESIERIRYSMFAKIPAYMISGTPILMYGPPGIAAVEYAMKGKWAYVVTEENPSLLKDAILKLKSDKELRNHFSNQARELAILHHDALKIRELFRQELTTAAFYTK